MDVKAASAPLCNGSFKQHSQKLYSQFSLAFDQVLLLVDVSCCLVHFLIWYQRASQVCEVSSMAFVPSSSTSSSVPPPFSTGFLVNHSSTKCSSFSLNNDDNTCILLVCTPLSGDNYNSWSCFMLMALNAKNKIGFVDGTLKKPSNTTVKYIVEYIMESGRKRERRERAETYNGLHCIE